jgi:hypothetical protein
MARHLELLYEQARYAPRAAAFSAGVLDVAQRELVSLASAANA